MNTTQLKDNIKHYLADIEDERFLKSLSAMIQTFVKEQDQDFAERLTPAQLASIQHGLQQIKEGKTVPHELARKRYKKWL